MKTTLPAEPLVSDEQVSERYEVVHFRARPGEWQGRVLLDASFNNTVGMRRIVVESRKDLRVAPILDALADGCRALGHQVTRWRGPLSGRVPYSRRMPICDVAILFNGLHRSYSSSLATVCSLGITPIFVELGWYPQNGTFQIDPVGINATAGWCQKPLVSRPITTLPVRSQGDLLLLLQLDSDSQISNHSPWFANMAQWLSHVSDHSHLPLRIRRHPLSQPSAEVVRLVEERHLAWDHCTSLADSLATARAVACINSSGAVEALAHKIPVLCYGESVFRHAGAVYCLNDDGAQTSAITGELAAGNCRLSEQLVGELVARVTANQWTIYDVPQRLPLILRAVLAHRKWSIGLPSRGSLAHRSIARTNHNVLRLGRP